MEGHILIIGFIAIIMGALIHFLGYGSAICFLLFLILFKRELL